MNIWRSLFGYSKSTASITKPTQTRDAATINKSISALRDAQELLEDRETRLEKEGAKLAISAKRKLEKNNRKGALYDLKRRKILDKELSMIVNKKLTLERQIGALGAAVLNTNVYESIKEGVEVLRTESSSNVIDEVEEMMEKQSELMDMQDAIDGALSRDLNNDISDDDLLKELDELEGEVNNTPNEVVQCEFSNKKLEDKKSSPVNKPAYRRAKAKDKHMDIAPFSKKRKLQDLDLKVAEQKLAPAAKKKRLGFSFPTKRQFPRVARLKVMSEPVVNRDQKAEAQSITTKPRKPLPMVVKSGEDIKKVSVIAVDKEEASNLALLETLYD